MSQYGFNCYHSCQVQHCSIVCLSMDSIVIIAVRSNTGVLYVCVYYIAVIAVRSSTGVLYVSVWIILLSQLSGLALEYCTSQYIFYCYYCCQVWHWIIVRLSMDSIVIIAVRSGTGVLCLSMDSIVIAVRSGMDCTIVIIAVSLALEYCTSQYGFYCYHSCQI